ncbi:hypothetical protein LM1A4_025 [Leuconostoc phage 1-A4]|uniref:Uncharacterized protein n=1 Tax=Leuconostoc phage 1-A4 TaxID=745088 RepID=D4N4J8_9CAUD|nr:hypothetical protein LM1A4_025 [Leuconostoc phage 1-A4]ADD71748.1 hypothetical protein LM1A4_025 [Leuconostoc phage 1-A4]
MSNKRVEHRKEVTQMQIIIKELTRYFKSDKVLQQETPRWRQTIK